MKNLKKYENYWAEQEVADDQYKKNAEAELEKETLKSYVDIFFNDPQYKNMSADEKYDQICKEYTLSPDMKEKLHKMVFKSTYENRIDELYIFEPKKGVNAYVVQLVGNGYVPLSVFAASSIYGDVFNGANVLKGLLTSMLEREADLSNVSVSDNEQSLNVIEESNGNLNIKEYFEALTIKQCTIKLKIRLTQVNLYNM